MTRESNDSLTLNYKVEHTNVKCKGYIVLLHGLFGTMDFWKNCLEHMLSWGYTCIRIDLLGFGDSPSYDELNYDVKDHINAIVDTLIAIKKKHNILNNSLKNIGIGFSLGGILLLNLHTAFELFDDIILISVPFYINKKFKMRISKIKKIIDVTKKLYESNKGNALILFVYNMFTKYGMDNTDFLKDFYKHNTNAGVKTIQNVVFMQDTSELLKKCKQSKITTINGRKDVLCDIKQIGELYNEHSHILNYHFLDDGNHDVIYTHTSDALKIIKNTLDKENYSRYFRL